MIADPRSSILGPRFSFWLPATSLCWREVVRFYRQPSRLIGGLGSPLVFWLLIGSGLGSSFRHPGAPAAMNYLEYFFPGTLALIVLFTAIFSTVSIIEDRREGFLQAVLVAPVSRTSVVLGKILGGTALASAQGILFLVLSPAAGIRPSVASVLLASVVVCLLAFALTGVGFLVAWPMESVQGFHSIMNLFLIPMWLLSGALFPDAGAYAPIRWAMMLNPLSYGVEALRMALYWEHWTWDHSAAWMVACLGVTVLFGTATLTASVLVASRPSRGGR
ncbi:MAG: ABC transporter permease [Planctomycetes bacterium]|nr:ABC transporter permease [Planctomycetota bacterium]